jgi:hypothetical protein
MSNGAIDIVTVVVVVEGEWVGVVVAVSSWLSPVTVVSMVVPLVSGVG